MNVNHEYSVEFLVSKLGPYVETNPVTGRPRLIKGLNEVWQAIEEFGGIGHVAKYFDIAERFVHNWIDNHYIPVIFASEISKKLGYSNADVFQEPSTGYQDLESGYCWPITWGL